MTYGDDMYPNVIGNGTHIDRSIQLTKEIMLVVGPELKLNACHAAAGGSALVGQRGVGQELGERLLAPFVQVVLRHPTLLVQMLLGGQMLFSCPLGLFKCK